MSKKTVILSENQYAAMLAVVNNAKRDYLALKTNNFEDVPTANEWKSAIENLGDDLD